MYTASAQTRMEQLRDGISFVRMVADTMLDRPDLKRHIMVSLLDNLENFCIMFSGDEGAEADARYSFLFIKFLLVHLVARFGRTL